MTRNSIRKMLRENVGRDECMLSKRAKEWVELMNKPTKNEPYGTAYSFKELIEKYTDIVEVA